MRSTLTVTLRDGRIGTTNATTAADLLAIGDFIASLGTENPNAEWTISASNGPDHSARYSDIASIDLRVEA
jgi:hypothetical protein